MTFENSRVVCAVQALVFGCLLAQSLVLDAQGFVKCQDKDGNWLYLDGYSSECEKNLEGMDDQGQQVWQSDRPPTNEESIQKQLDREYGGGRPSSETEKEEVAVRTDEIVGCWSLKSRNRVYEYTYQMLKNGNFVAHLLTGEERGNWIGRSDGRYFLESGGEGEYFRIEDEELESYDSAGLIRSLVKTSCYSSGKSEKEEGQRSADVPAQVRYSGCEPGDDYYWDENGVIKNCNYIKDERKAGYGPCIKRHRDATGYISTEDVERCLARHIR